MLIHKNDLSTHGRSQTLDVLRGFAIIGVICSHAALMLPKDTLLFQIEVLGRFGVQAFFIISAITLCLANLHNGVVENLLQFYLKRLLRIFPLWIIFLFVYSKQSEFFSFDFLLTLSFLSAFSVTAINKIIPGGYSIVAEVMFYFIFPIMIKVFYNSRRALLAAFCVYFLNLLLAEPILKYIFMHYANFDDLELRNFFYEYILNHIYIFLFGISIFFIIQQNVQVQKSHKIHIFFIFWIVISSILSICHIKDFLHGTLFLIITVVLYYAILTILKYNLFKTIHICL